MVRWISSLPRYPHSCKRPTSFRRVVARLPLLELTDPATMNKETTRCVYYNPWNVINVMNRSKLFFISRIFSIRWIFIIEILLFDLKEFKIFFLLLISRWFFFEVSVNFFFFYILLYFIWWNFKVSFVLIRQ